MITIGFVGGYEKTDLILYMSKIITITKKKVLVIDATSQQKTKYIVPAIFPTKSYITEFEGIDFAVGFENMEEIKKYLGDTLDYDIIIYDVDTIKYAEQFEIKRCDKNYLVTSLEVYSLRKGIDILSNIDETTEFNKIIFANYEAKEEEKYIEYLLLGKKIQWKETMFFPVLVDDYSVCIENRNVSKIKMKKLSTTYKDGLVYLIKDILGEASINEIKKAIKIAERDS